MQRDRGPVFQLGFGAQSRQLNWDEGETEGPNPESGAVAKALHQHPVMRFFAVSAASMVGMVVGGKVLREGGVRLGLKLQETNKTWVTNSIRSIRQIQQELDHLQGVKRVFADGETYSTSTKLFERGADNKIIRDEIHDQTGFWFTDAERRARNKFGIEGPVHWTVKDSIQKKLVAQARRLPYELPAMYFAQRGITDKLFGSDDNKNVNWANPVDVITDFVTTSTRNLATMILPFETGGAATSHTWKKFMSLGDDFANLSVQQQKAAAGSVVLKDILERVGHDATDLLNKAVKVSSQVSGSLSTGINEARKRSVTLPQHMHAVRHGTKQAELDAQAKLLKKGKRWVTPDLLDVMPGPFRGMRTGYAAGKERFHEIGRGHVAFDNLMRLGKEGFEKEATRLGTKATSEGFDQVALQSIIGTGNNPIEELASQLRIFGRGGPKSAAWRNSDFFKGQTQYEYERLITNRMKKAGLSDEAAEEFGSLVRFQPPTRADKHLSNRISFGNNPIDAAEPGDVISELSRRLTGTNFGNAERNIIRSKLAGVIQRTDEDFVSEAFQAKLQSKLASQWNLASEKIISSQAENLLKKSRLPFNDFVGDLDGTQKQFLSRKTAQLTGLKITDEYGSVVKQSVIDDHLKKVGYNPQNFDKMRALLVTRGAINKPWNKGSANIFGLKPLGVQDALSRGYFRSGPFAEEEVARVSRRMAANDPLGYGGYNLSGVYQTSSGRVLDFTRIQSSMTSFLDKVSASTQIPLIHVSPLELFGYSAKQDLRERAILQYAPGNSRQKFLPGQQQSQYDFYLWMRNKGRGSKGNVFGFGTNKEGVRFGAKFEGEYRPWSATSQNIASSIIRLGAGDTGYRPTADQVGQKGRLPGLKRALDVSDHQPDSLFRLASRYMKRKSDLNNPTVMAQLLNEGQVTHKGKVIYRIVNGEVLDAENNKVPEAAASAFRNFAGKLRGFGLSEKTVDGISSRFNHIFNFTFTGTKPTTFVPGKDGRVDISKLKTPAQLREAARLMITEDAGLASSLGEQKAGSLKRAQDSLLWRHLNEGGSSSRWSRDVPGSGQSTTIHTRADALRADIYKYLTIRSSVTGVQDFNQLLPDMLSEISKLRASRVISQAEFTEARAALLSTQINFLSFTHYQTGASAVGRTMDIFNSIASNRGATKGILGDLAEGKFGLTGKLGPVKPGLRKRFGIGAYEYPGTEYNPFGNTDSVFVPTFGTAAQRDAAGAVGSVLGWNTWNRPEVFSGASIPGSHFINRLNKYAGTLGMALDANAYSGPLALYAKGMVGKRALPLVAGGTTLLAADRTIGGFVNDKDPSGERVYSPFFLGAAATGVVNAQAAFAGAIPGGQSFDEKKEELTEGEVAVRAGRWWPLGSTPWRGGRIQYYRPSWYRRLQSGYTYTDQTHGSPLERLAFGYDFSPLRPLDPYRFERQHMEDRPYPTTGSYFTGPWGPLTGALNATIGKILKPELQMHKGEVESGLAAYNPVGEGGAFLPSFGYTGAGGGGAVTGSGGGALAIGASNATYASAGQFSNSTASMLTASAIGGINQSYASAAYGTPNMGTGVMDPRIISGIPPITMSSMKYQAGQFGYQAQELLGIYGFMFASVRSSLGFGTGDFDPQAPVLASASAAYGSTRSFWDLNLGGLGDAPLPIEGNFANLEFSEIVRRFIPKERTGTQVINPIRNAMSVEQPWLPGDNYYINFDRGDPYTAIPEGEMRLPGQGYERFNKLHPDQYGNYGLVDQHKILGDVAPWSAEYRAIDQQVRGAPLTSVEREIIETTRSQVAAKSIANEFTPYVHKYEDVTETAKHPYASALGRFREWLGHRNTYINTKFMQERTAVEDWERDNVYGATFPQWQTPVESFLKPMVHNATQRNPISAALLTGAVGSLFGRGAAAKSITSVIGGAVGLAAGSYGQIHQAITGDRYIPASRRKEIALEEYTDILTYVKNMHLYNQSMMSGDSQMASTFRQAAQQTMYGADIYNGDLNAIASAIPKRKREHFRAMLAAPPQERAQILSTAGRLERRIYQAAWGMPVEERPDLQEYFQDHELPSPGWEGFHPNTNMDHIKIKMGQSLGISMSEMGYYPQQIREANLVNPSYPNFESRSNQGSVMARLKQLMAQQGIDGDVVPVYTPYPGTRVEMSQGILAGV